MNWEKSFFLGVLASMTILVMAGCGTAVVKTSAVEPIPSVTQQAASSTRQAPLSNTNINGTMAFPPSDNMTGTPPAAPTMDLAVAAAKLGVTDTQLREALGDTQGFPDLAAAAKKLSITEDALRQALGFSNNGTMPGGPPISGTAQASQTK
jgi:hypothetical protein